ncbi:nuclear transport factor 2 family protein [Sphingomonas sp. LY54]|uniref:nuclear transport factor 2 family protein n=1 Tax=Sphingomonas sp. LY54 TaxID=3095343 RepID=UPI002D78A0FE|nr:nuclear transport factor 2 family protein [Sphingomonas sp. LY54]WRP27222.1 nuclear transport factor 2 family protein [Sphingomonas sp. LY54]
MLAALLLVAWTGVQPSDHLSLPAPSATSSSLPSEAETEAFLRRSAEQWAASDREAMARFLAEDYVGVASNGEIRNRVRQLQLAAEPSPYPVTRVDYVRFHHHGPLVIAQGAETLTPGDGGPDRRLIWTDTWLFRQGRWQVVASQDSVRPAEGHDEERAAILALRADNNRSIAAQDVEGIMRIAAPDYVLVSGGGTIVRSAAQMRSLWASDPQRCTRTPRRVDVGAVENRLRAAESGEWRCDDGRAGAVVNGSYFAHWTKVAGEWRVVSDTYVSLGCRAEGCGDQRENATR